MSNDHKPESIPVGEATEIQLSQTMFERLFPQSNQAQSLRPGDRALLTYLLELS